MTALGSPWPATALDRDGALEIGGVASEELARRFGTPLYVYDGATLRERAQAYLDGVAGHPDAHVSFACKACCTVGVLRLLGECGLGADVASAGELAAALRAGIDPSRIVVHGNGKTDADIEAALTAGCALIVLDGPDEGARVAIAAKRHGRRQPVAVRVTPGIVAGGHEKIATGHPGSKFGLAPAEAARVCHAALADPHLEWRGLHVHLGSQVDDPGVLEGIVRWFREFSDEHALEPRLIDVGGGLSIPYGYESAPDARALAAAVAAAALRQFPAAQLLIEPGRSVAGPAGVTLYRVLTRKTAADGTRWVALDGGMADNVRPAMYGATYTVAAAGRLGEARAERVALAGRHCESGDVLARDLDLPPLASGDLVAFAATGAYAQSMASTYNAMPRLAAVLVEHGEARLLTRRETISELLDRDV
ncbi:MAG: diaminopimelate decarboxylase [Gaiellales bacterium]|nr:diaminopimelate decarboxylase [Gaiellales bacterium]